MKILIVDDEESILDMYTEKLVAEKFTVITAPDGIAGLKKAEEEGPDVILLDIIMPQVNGLDILKQLKGNDKTKKIPVYLLTNIPEGSSTGKAKELGADGYLLKAETEPMQLSEFLKELKGKMEHKTS